MSVAVWEKGLWIAKKQTHAGSNQGKWCVYRPDGIRFVVCENRKHAKQLVYALRTATQALDGNWHEIITQD